LTGGIDVAAEWAGFETIAQVERDPYCLKVLAKHWPNVERIEQIEDVTAKSIGRPVTLVSGGPPCQPSSTAGKRRGRSDDRWLWPEFARVVECFLPSWILAENPPGILSLENNLAIEEWLARLEAQGYTWLPPLVYPIAALGADHRRYRVFFIAHLDGVISKREQVGIARSGISTQSYRDCQITSNLNGEHSNAGGYGAGEICGERSEEAKLSSRETQTDTDCQGRAYIQRKSISARTYRGRASYSSGWWDTRSRLLRMVHGVRGRMDGRRIKALGNSCSPQQVYPILKAIADIEMGGER